MRNQSILDQQLLELGFQLEWSQAGRWIFPGNKRIADIAGIGHPNIAGKLRDIKYIDVKKVAAPDRRIHRVSRARVASC